MISDNQQLNTSIDSKIAQYQIELKHHKKETDRIEATLETLADKDVMGQIAESEKDIEEGRTKPWKKIKIKDNEDVEEPEEENK